MQVLRDFLSEVCELSEIQNLKVTTKAALRAGTITGLCVTIGVLALGGIPGVILGATIGGGISLLTIDDVKSVPHIIMCELTPQQQKDLVATIVEALSRVGVENFVTLTAQAALNPAIADLTTKVVKSFFTKQLNMKILE